MKKYSIGLSALVASAALSSAGTPSAKSLYDLAPEEGARETLPLTYTAGVNLGYDDNPTPLIGGDSALYGQGYVRAAFLSSSPQTDFDFGAQIGVIHYFDNLDVPGRSVDDTMFTASLTLNWTHRVSERLRFVSRNNITYELEPDYSIGFQAQRQVGNYLRWSSDNAVGYRWTERLATYSGVRYEGITFDDIPGGDRSLVTLYNDFRYQVSERTVASFSYRYQDVSADAQVSDATNQFVLAGIEHRFTPQSYGVVRGGVQIRDVDGGKDSNSPYLEASLRTQVNESFAVRSYARYGVEDWQRFLSIPTVGGVLYDNTDTLRIGFSGDYQLSEQLVFTGGVNYVFLDFTERRGLIGPAAIEEELLNAYIGVNLQITDDLNLNARYNFEDLSSDAGRDYDRNRISIGATTTF